MKKTFRKLPEPLTRLAIAFIVFIGLGLFVVVVLIPPRMKNVKIQWAAAVEREKARPLSYAGAIACGECHDRIVARKKGGYHKDLSCETCHGAAKAHTEDPDKVKPVIPRERKFCPLCHTYNESRPRGFPQINPIVHNPMKPCITCHQPHDPKPPTVPKECSACHGEIARTKAVSHHALLECTTCHTTPKQHKIAPRSVKPTKPTTREFCGRCHAKDASHKGAPKIDITTHGEKYICWQCHYPHSPEVEE